eukprot:g8110.t1
MSRSFLCLRRENPLRRIAFNLSHHPWFDRAVSVVIVLNSIALALTDFGCYDGDGLPAIERRASDPAVAQPCDSWRNLVVNRSDPIFVAIFTLECVVKVASRGFWGDEHSYLHDPWNRLDFLVVLSGLAEYVLSGQGWVRALRTARVLRPLQALHEFPRLCNLVTSMMMALPALGNVALLMLFVFAVFGILALQLWGATGLMHGRCRLTPVPVRLPPRLGPDAGFPEPYRPRRHDAEVAAQYWSGALPACLPGVANDDAAAWAAAGPQANCTWPIAHADTRLCALAKAPGGRACGVGSGSWQQVCGSNYVVKAAADGLASVWEPATVHERFTAAATMQADWKEERLLWGLGMFDNFARASLSMFQCVTLESWAFISYTVGDAFSHTVSSCYFFALVLVGSWFMVNFTVAVLYQEFLDAELRTATKNAEQRRLALGLSEQAGAGAATGVNSELLGEHDHHHHSALDALDAMSHVKHAKEERRGSVGQIMYDRAHQQLHRAGHGLRRASHVVKNKAMGVWHAVLRSRCVNARTSSPRWQQLAHSAHLERLVVLVIVLNTVTLAMDRAAQPCAEAFALEWANVVFTVLFATEAAIKIGGLSLRGYLADGFNAFDATIVSVSLLELALQPPQATLAASCVAARAGGGFSALRTFRLLRVMRLMKELQGLHALLDVILEMCKQMTPFAALVLLFIFIFALLGMQLFALRFRFRACTDQVVGFELDNVFATTALALAPCTQADNPVSCARAPMARDCFYTERSNFDDLLTAFNAVFQTITGEDWNALMISAHRGAGVLGVLYFITCVMFGYFLLLNLFLAMLLGCFEAIRIRDEESSNATQATEG